MTSSSTVSDPSPTSSVITSRSHTSTSICQTTSCSPRDKASAPHIEEYNIRGSLASPGQLNFHTLGSSQLKTHQGDFRRIGHGFCGSVWTQGKATWAIKRADGAPTRYLWKEYYMQNRVLAALERFPTPSFRVPASFWYISADDDWWHGQLPRLPSNPPQEACNAMCSERIPSLSREFRDILIDSFCPQAIRSEIKRSDSNADCITRLYLGKRRGGMPSKFFSLRNFPLLLNHMEQLGLPVFDYARAMAGALACMHWEAEIDANDVEFVLGSRRQLDTSPLRLPPAVIGCLPYDFCTRAGVEAEPVDEIQDSSLVDGNEVWLLDFDCCGSITMDYEGVEKAALAAHRNDPYHPRPCSSESPDFELWKTFRDHYLNSSAKVVRRRGVDVTLPERFIARLIELQSEPKPQQNQPPMPTDTNSQFYNAFVTGQADDEQVVEDWCNHKSEIKQS